MRRDTAGVWPDTQVTEGSLLRAVSLVRAALGERGLLPGRVVTVPRRGYRFEADVPEAAYLPERPSLVPQDDPASRYVGRAALIARLEERLDGALAGNGRILFLVGEAGIGKTRTAELLAARAQRAGACVVAAFGPPTDATADAGWAHALRSLAASTPEGLAELPRDARAALARLVPEIGSAPRPRAGPHGEDAERFALFDAVRRFLAVATGIRPLAILLDDLQAADADSITLLGFVGHSVAALPCAIVVTCRDEEAGGAPRHARAIERLLRLTALVGMPRTSTDAPPAQAEELQLVLGIEPTTCPILEPPAGEGLPADCRVTLAEQEIPAADLPARVMEILGGRPADERVLFLAADDRLNYEGVLRIVDLAKSSVDDLSIEFITTD